MDERRKLVFRALTLKEPISSLAIEFGVSRTTAHMWVKRGREQGVTQFQELSRKPLKLRESVSEDVVKKVLALKADREHWGAKKIHHALWADGDAPVCPRTIGRILRQNLGPTPKPVEHPSVGRYERAKPNELWQMDFKGLGENPPPYLIFSFIDDHSRFALGLPIIAAPTKELVFDAVWEMLGAFGMPEEILSDNESCFHSTHSLGPSYLEAKLWRLGIKTPHGRPAHPQTQGKVERFHRTMQQELGVSLRGPDPDKTSRLLEAFQNDYNWARPHESLNGRLPGSVYRVSEVPRPDQIPEATHPDGAELRRVGKNGLFKRKGISYRPGTGVGGDYVALLETERGLEVSYANRTFALLHQLKV